jgi:hypothetical protein
MGKKNQSSGGRAKVGPPAEASGVPVPTVGGGNPDCTDPGGCFAFHIAVWRPSWTPSASFYQGLTRFLWGETAQMNTNPRSPHLGPPRWTYQQSNGKTALKIGNLTLQSVEPGYSGHGKGWNDPESQSVGESDDKANAGPIPQGTYTIGPWYAGSKGNPMANLTPDPGTEMFGRDGMEWHANNDSKPPFSSSEGCIVSPRSAREAVAGSGITELEVVP